jgi:gluconate 5-dehydrogenase
VPHSLFDVRGRRALVTGSTRGIGSALARGLLEAGCTVVVHGSTAAGADGAAAALGATADAAGAAVHAVAFDVTDPGAIAAGVASAQSLAGPLDILVNNAGMQSRGPLLDVSDAAWGQMLDTNLTSAFRVAREVARGMVERGGGKIVNVTSIQSQLARPGVVPYAATKGGLRLLTQGMCAEWGPLGLQVNALAPGYIDTDLNRALVGDPEFSAWVRGRTPARRWGRAEDLVGALLFLVAPASDFVNGHTLQVDGGMVAVV